MHVGIAHHYGWAIAVTASADHSVVDRRRIELIESGVPSAPVHHLGGTHAMHNTSTLLDDAALAALVLEVRESVTKVASSALDDLAASLPSPVESISVRSWPNDLPTDIAVLRRPPYESRVDSAMYCEVLAQLGRVRRWPVHVYDVKTVVPDAQRILGARADDVLLGPRARLGPPWTKDHRVALAATVIAAVE